jgi:phage terminase small subunit
MKTKSTPPPAHLNTEGQAVWNKFVAANPNHEVLGIYCAAHERFLAAKADIETRGASILIVGDRGHKTEKVNPSVAVEATAQRTMLACASRLNLRSEQ